MFTFSSYSYLRHLFSFFTFHFLRSILRSHDCLSLLLGQLTSTSLTIVSNACGTLWYLSERCAEDQEALRSMNAAFMLRKLTQSKHRTIATCSERALSNLTRTAAPAAVGDDDDDGSSSGGRRRPSLEARRRKNLALELEEQRQRLEVQEISGGSSEEEMEEDRSRGNSSAASSHRAALKSTNGNALVESAAASSSENSGQIELMRQEDGSVVRQPLELSKSRKQMFLKPVVQQPPPQAYPDQQDGDQQQAFQPQMEISSQFATTPLSPDAEAFAERDERIMSPSNLVMRESFRQQQQQQQAQQQQQPEEGADDRPTDYSARFGDCDEEDDVEQEEVGEEEDVEDEVADAHDGRRRGPQASERNERGQEARDPEDAVRTYCMEATPYDTPYHVSHAGSMSDLREEGATSSAAAIPAADSKRLFVKRPVPSRGANATNAYNSTGVANDQSQQASAAPTRSGVETPMSLAERPLAYCTEDTPGCFSREDSMSSLDSEDLGERESRHQQLRREQDEILAGEKEEKGQLEASHSKEASPLPPPQQVVNAAEGRTEAVTLAEEERNSTPPMGPPPPTAPMTHKPAPQSTPAASAPARTVSFNPQETPLMYSRASSFESLNSFDQQSIRDGYSSCDFSRVTSGRVSPSELPDSPGAQTPPRRNKSPQPPPHPQPRSRGEVARGAVAPVVNGAGFPALISDKIPTSETAATASIPPPPSEDPKPPSSPREQLGGGFLPNEEEGGKGEAVPSAAAASSPSLETREVWASPAAEAESDREKTAVAKAPVSSSSSSKATEEEVEEGGDRVRSFAEEGTPAVFSSRTSLSRYNYTDTEEEEDDRRARDAFRLANTAGPRQDAPPPLAQPEPLQSQVFDR